MLFKGLVLGLLIFIAWRLLTATGPRNGNPNGNGSNGVRQDYTDYEEIDRR